MKKGERGEHLPVIFINLSPKLNHLHMSLSEAFKGAKMIETLENFSISDQNQIELGESSISRREDEVYDDGKFWGRILKNPELHWRKNFNLYSGVISDWVPRIPGLYWAKGSSEIRELAEAEIYRKWGRFVEYYPPGKSEKVMGGVGSYLFPPDSNGNYLMSWSSSGNSSVGIPLLLSSEVIDFHQIKPGDVIDIRDAEWQKMSTEWIQRFSSIEGVPKACFTIKNPQQIDKYGGNRSFEFHPFSIMEYETEGALLYDFVFVTVVYNPYEPDYRGPTAVFFEEYKKKETRNGKYLLTVDMNNPLVEADFYTPEDIRKQNPYGEAQLNLLTARIRNATFNEKILEELLAFLATNYPTQAQVAELSIHIKVNPAYLAGTTGYQHSISLLDKCIRENKVEELILAISKQFPQIINH